MSIQSPRNKIIISHKINKRIHIYTNSYLGISIDVQTIRVTETKIDVSNASIVESSHYPSQEFFGFATILFEDCKNIQVVVNCKLLNLQFINCADVQLKKIYPIIRAIDFYDSINIELLDLSYTPLLLMESCMQVNIQTHMLTNFLYILRFCHLVNIPERQQQYICSNNHHNSVISDRGDMEFFLSRSDLMSSKAVLICV